MHYERTKGATRGWIIVAVSTFALIVSNGLTIGGMPVFYKPIQNDFIASGALAADHAQTFISVGATLTFFLSGVFSMIGGWLIPRTGLKRLMILGCLCLGGGLALHAEATSVWMVYLSRVLMGVSLGFVGVTPNVVLVSNWFREARGTALGIMLTGTSIGGFIVPIFAAPMIGHFGWRTAMLLLSASVWLVLLPAVVFLVTEGPEAETAETISLRSGLTLAEAVRTPIFWVFALCAALVFYPIFVVSQQFILYLQSPKIGMQLAIASWLQSILFAASVVGKFTAGAASDRIPATRVMLLCSAVMFLSTLVLFDLTAANALIFLVPFALGYGGTFVLLQRIASDYFGMKEYGRILGTIVMVEISGAAVGVPVTGYLADKAGGDYTTAFYAVAAVTAAAVICTVLLNLMYRGSRQVVP